MLRIVSELLHPLAQLRHMHVQVLRRLNIRHASILDQAHRLKLELSRKLTPLHDPPPAPSKHLTRCLRNRVQAIDLLLDQGLTRQSPGGRPQLQTRLDAEKLERRLTKIFRDERTLEEEQGVSTL